MKKYIAIASAVLLGTANALLRYRSAPRVYIEGGW